MKCAWFAVLLLVLSTVAHAQNWEQPELFNVPEIR